MPHLRPPPQVPLDLAMVASAHMHTPMKLEAKLEKDSILNSQLGNPIVDESDSAPTTEQNPKKMEKQEKHAPPQPPPVRQGGSQKASHVSPKMMLLKAQHALKERVAINDTKKTKKEKNGLGAISTKRKRLEVESDTDTTTKSEAHEEKPAAKKKKGDGGKSLQPKAPMKKKNAKAKIPPQLQAQPENESPNQNPKEVESPKKKVTMVLHMQMRQPHPKQTHPLQRCDTVVFTRIPCYVACATSVQPLCNLCKRSLSRGCTHLHTGCTSYLHRTRRGNGGRRQRTSVRRRARSLVFRPVAVYGGACWKGRVEATDSPSVANANLKKAT